MKLLIDREAAQKILQYLASRPYAETFELIPGLLNMKQGTEVAVAAPQPSSEEPTTSPSVDKSEANG